MPILFPEAEKHFAFHEIAGNRLLLLSVASSAGVPYLQFVPGLHREFWERHKGLVWSNPDADDAVYIRAALLRPRFQRLLDIAVEFGLDRVRHEWDELMTEGTPAVRRARQPVERILANIETGFSRAASSN